MPLALNLADKLAERLESSSRAYEVDCRLDILLAVASVDVQQLSDENQFGLLH